MRFRHPDGSLVHLAYCSNVHPAEEVQGILAQLERFSAPVREVLGSSRLGIGLWLAAPAAARLRKSPSELAELRSRLDEHGLEVVTLNGFPYQAFHAPVVKKNVYYPDWTDPDRAEYTLTLARLLSELLPKDAEEGSISTLPLGWREGWSARSSDAARYALQKVAGELEKLSTRTGKPIRLALEPEPGCTVETVEGAIGVLKDIDPEWVGLCLDACHLAVKFEEPEESLAALREAEIPVVKAQLSSALRAKDSGSEETRSALSGYVEPRFLHQTRERTAKGVAGVDDLNEALSGGLPGEDEWRVHFHVPIHHSGDDTTQPELMSALRALLGGPTPVTTHLEVETYTWSVLPPGEQPGDEAGLVSGLARELSWSRQRLLELGMEEMG